MIVGSPQKVKEQIETMCRAYDADECMIVTITYDFEAKLTSYRLIAEAFGLKSE
jgi:alkanesulfonate monooxygenase SsuD/methylene tetrahydromethanopterin reductase-like flavin-dependent oxidoreductase (luciferase family)